MRSQFSNVEEKISGSSAQICPVKRESPVLLSEKIRDRVVSGIVRLNETWRRTAEEKDHVRQTISEGIYVS
jgi:hypothetical protein